MKKEKKVYSFATRLSQWVMLVLFVMMSALAIFIYYITGMVLLETEASTIKNSMKSAERNISDMMSDVMVAGYRGAYRKTKQAYTQLWHQLY